MDTCTLYLRMIFPIFLQHGSLNLHPRMGSNKKFCFSCLVLCLSHWSSSKIITTGFIFKALMLIIFTNFDFPSCSKLVLSSIALFTFLMMSHWLILDKIISLNLITSAITLTILDVSDIWFSRAAKTSKGFVARHTGNLVFNSGSFLLTWGIILLSSQAAPGSQRSCTPRYYITLTLSQLQTSILLDA